MGWIGNIFIIIGTVCLGNKWKSGFLYSALGNAFWCLWSLEYGFNDLLFIEGLFILLSIWNYHKWWVDEKNKEVMICL